MKNVPTEKIRSRSLEMGFRCAKKTRFFNLGDTYITDRERIEFFSLYIHSSVA